VPLPDRRGDVHRRQIKSNIRELEGSLIRLIAYASLDRAEISLDSTQEVLRTSSTRTKPSRSNDSKFVSDYYQLKHRRFEVAQQLQIDRHAAAVAMYLQERCTHASLPEIGRSFGGKHHSTVPFFISLKEGSKDTSKTRRRFSTASS
jgi:chromosomal replication initiator protein